MLITVAICTWNRAGLLDRTLGEMRKLDVPAGVEWELLVVDNNSTDGTSAVLARYAKMLPLRAHFEPRQGKSHALNRAVAEAAGELIVWTDDDVLVDPGWLAAYAAASRQWPDAGFFGGPVRPWFEGQPPRWLLEVWDRISLVYAACQCGPDPAPCSKASIPGGCNLAVRTCVQSRYLYDPAIGPRGARRINGEDTAVVTAMLDDGVEGIWVPGASLRHYVPHRRQTTGYVREWFQAHGEYSATMHPDAGGMRLFGKPLWLWRGAVAREIRYRFHRLFSRPQIWIEDLIEAGIYRGHLRANGRAGRPGGPALVRGLEKA